MTLNNRFFMNTSGTKAGFSLVEILVAAMVTVVLVGALYTFFSGVYKHFTRGTVLLELEKESRLVMERLKNDIRGACTRGITRMGAPPDTQFHMIIAEEPYESYGEPRSSITGKQDYIHGRTLKFFKFRYPGVKQNPPTASLVTWTSYEKKDSDGKNWMIVQRTEDNLTEKILRIRQKGNDYVYLYFVVFSVDEVTREIVKQGDASPEEIGSGGRFFVRIHFEISQEVNKIARKMKLITAVYPRQLNIFDRDPHWKPNPHSMVEVPTDLQPS